MQPFSKSFVFEINENQLAMKTCLLLFSVFFASFVYAQDDDWCICMLDQPPYEASLDNGVQMDDNPFSNLFEQTSEDESKPLIFLEEYEPVEDFVDDEKELDELEPDLERSKSALRKKKKYRIPRWNAHKKPKKYKGKCPFF